MLNKFFKITAILTISVLVLFSVSLMGFAATAKTDTTVVPDRTTQERMTGVITYNPVTIPHYAVNTTLSGKVVVDGPQLVLKVNGTDVTALANVVKTADKTWTFSYTYNFNNAVGDISINLEAYTIYVNGKTAGNIHTGAAPVTQKVHVPYVKALEYSNLSWNSYDRITNVFGFSYNLMKVWDDGVFETAAQSTAATVEGTQSYMVMAADTIPNNGTLTKATITPPVVFRNFAFPTAGDYIWTYDTATRSYSVSFSITKTYSNGTTSAETKTITGLTPGTAGTISVTIEGVTNSTNVTVPAAPSAPVAPSITVSKVEVVFVSKATIAENENKNNYRVTYNLKITMSDNSINTFSNLEETVPNNGGNNSGSKAVTKTFNISGKDYTVTYVVTAN